MLAQNVAVARGVVAAEKHLGAASATLRDVVRQSGNDDAGEAGHGERLGRGTGKVIRMHYHRKPPAQ